MKVYKPSGTTDHQAYYGMRVYDKFTNKTLEYDFSKRPGDDKRARSAYWEVLSPSQSASSVHRQMRGMLGNLLQRQGLRLEQRPTGDLCLLTVIHSSRLEADISRDSRCLQGEKEDFQAISTFFLYLQA